MNERKQNNVCMNTCTDMPMKWSLNKWLGTGPC
jgi:hypothetical protein